MVKKTVSFYIGILYRDFMSYTTRALKKHGLSYGQLPFILYVGKFPGCPQAELTKMMRLDWGHSQRTVAKLVDGGFMTKEYNEELACNCLNLTEAGQQAFQTSHEVFTAWDAENLNGLAPAEKEQLLMLLQKLLVSRRGRAHHEGL